MAEVRLTAEGVEKYEKRLEYLKTTARTEIAEQIKTARAFGDLSENAEYDAAKIEQARIEYEIVEIEAMLKNVVLIDEDTLNTNVVDVGSNVTVKMLSAGGEERTFPTRTAFPTNPPSARPCLATRWVSLLKFRLPTE